MRKRVGAGTARPERPKKSANTGTTKEEMTNSAMQQAMTSSTGYTIAPRTRLRSSSRSSR